MTDYGYCTIDDVRRALQDTEASFSSGALGANGNAMVVDAITAQSEWLEKTIKRHFYAPNGIDEDSQGIIPTTVNSRDDEESIPTGAAAVISGTPTLRTAQGSYTRIRLARRHAETITQLLVNMGSEGYVDWVADSDFDGGRWPTALGEDYYLRVNNGGRSELYLDTDRLYDAATNEWKPDSFVNAVYVSFEYGHEGIPETVRRAVAFRAASELVLDDEFATAIPDDGQLTNVETKAGAMREKAEELLEVYD